MAKDSVVVTVESHLGEIAEKAHDKAAVIVEKTGTDIEAGAKFRIEENGSVDTGNMLNSTIWTPVDELEGEVIVGADYGVFVENGTVHPSRTTRAGNQTRAYTIPARPFLVPAAEEARPGFELAVSRIFDT